MSGRVPVPAVARGPRLPASTGRLVLLRRRLAGERRAGQTAAVLRVIGERPGVSARELADASQVTGGTLYSLLRRLADDGTLEKRELAGGQTGYALATSPAPEQSAAAASQTAPTDGTGVQAPARPGPERDRADSTQTADAARSAATEPQPSQAPPNETTDAEQTDTPRSDR